MQLLDEIIKLPKENIYEDYLGIVYKPKFYDNVSRKQMGKEIIKEYNQELFLYSICTEKELKFLDLLLNGDFQNDNDDDFQKYYWEIDNLRKKFIISLNFEIYDDQLSNVKEAVKFYKQNKQRKQNADELFTMMIGIVKSNGDMLTKALVNMISSITEISEEGIEKLLGSPLFNFYCEFNKEYIPSLEKEEEIVSYRDYYELLDEIKERRKIYGIGGAKQIDIRDYSDIFYYDYPIRNKKVKKMYDTIHNDMLLLILYKKVIRDAQVLYLREILDTIIEDKKLVKIINEGLDECPCVVMNGFTPNQWKQEKEKEIILKHKFSAIPQNNAHLHKNEANEYYKLYFSLLDYINKKHSIEPNLKKIYKQEGLDVRKLELVNKYLWENKSEIDDYISENPNHFNKEELEAIRKFKNSITSNRFIVIGFEREYTEIFSPDDGKIYMVKGVRCDLDKILNPDKLPMLISTTLLMFNGKIIYNSFLSTITENFDFGNEFKEYVLNDIDNAIRYYYL